MQFDPSIAATGRVLGTLVFAAAVAGKLRHWSEFTGVVANYKLLPQRLATPVAVLVVALESLVVASLLTGFSLAAGALLGVGLLGVFAVAMAVNLARGRRLIDCGCFQSALRQHLSPSLVARNVLLMAVLLVPALSARPFTAPAAPQMFTALQLLDGLGAGITLFLIYLVSGELFALRDAVEALRKRFA